MGPFARQRALALRNELSWDNRQELGNNISIYNILDEDFGADPTGQESSSVALQLALDAACETGGIVFAPKGNYLLTNPDGPPQINSSGVWLQGAGVGNTKFTYSGTKGSALFIGGNQTVAPTGAQMAAGSGGSIQFDDYFYLDLRESTYATCNGWAAWSVGFWITVQNNNQAVVSRSYGKVFHTEEADSAWSIGLFPGATGPYLQTTILTSAGTATVNTGAVELAYGVRHYYEVTWDGTTLRNYISINGATANRVGNQVPRAGTLVQASTENVGLGACPIYYPSNNSTGETASGYTVDNWWIMERARHTGASFTPPTAEIVDLEANMKIVLLTGIRRGQYVKANTSGGFAWIPIHQSALTTDNVVSQCGVKGIEFTGSSGILLSTGIKCAVTDCKIFGFSQYGVRFLNNSFTSYGSNLDIIGNGIALINSSASGENIFTNMTLGGTETGLALCGSSALLQQIYITTATKFGILIRGGGGSAMRATLDSVSFSDENVVVAAEAALAIDQCKQVTVTGSSFAYKNLSANTRNVKLSPGEGSDVSRVMFLGCGFESHAGAAENIEFTDTPVEPVILLGCWSDPDVAWTTSVGGATNDPGTWSPTE